ncbi:sterol desaturase family protein, partial [Mameliella sp. AT18]|nr:sterol desaturase family protein [Mameliella sp. AT18]
MDDLQYGTRDKRGNWAPNAPLEIAPFWLGKFNKMGAFLVDYLWPWNAFHMATALLYWVFVIPDAQTLATLSWGWPLYLLLVNMAGIFAMYGAIELFYYVRRRQGTRFKYNAKFPA